jgi:hypothetical protein
VNSAVVGNGTGLTGQYFKDQTLTNLALTRTDRTVNFNWGSGSPDPSIPADHFSARWTGQVQAQFSETYTFYTNSDDGVRLWVNGVQLVNNWTDHANTQNSGTIALVAGQKYAIKMEYYENAGQAVAKLLWSSPSTPKAAIPTKQLYVASVTATRPSITTQPASLTVTAGQAASFTVAATGTAPLTYQWQKLSNGTWANISGATAATFRIAATAAADTGSYRALVSNSAGQAISNPATLTVNAAATAVTMGETNVAPTDDSGNAKLLLAQQATLTQAGTLQSLSFYVTQAAGSLGLGVYDATGPNGGPGKLLAQTNSFSPVVGWNTANVIAPVHLAPGTYWLAYLPSDNNLQFRVDRSSGTLEWFSYPFGPMASTFSTTPTVEAAHWSLYATLTPG